MFKWLLPIFIISCALTPVYATAPKGLIEGWTPQTHLALSHCMIAEADEAEGDHIAVAFAARNWWKIRKRKHALMRYVDILRGYCTIHKPVEPTPRQRWIRQLSFPELIDGQRIVAKPADFNPRASWPRKHKWWLKVLQTAHDWNQGKFKDPCKGQASHWGAPSTKSSRWYLKTDDPALTGRALVRLDCSDDLVNDYYRAMTKAEKREFAQKRELAANDHM